eukprot:358512-Chlamydomonas_euryale.AAC.3
MLSSGTGSAPLAVAGGAAGGFSALRAAKCATRVHRGACRRPEAPGLLAHIDERAPCMRQPSSRWSNARPDEGAVGGRGRGAGWGWAGGGETRRGWHSWGHTPCGDMHTCMHASCMHIRNKACWRRRSNAVADSSPTQCPTFFTRTSSRQHALEKTVRTRVALNGARYPPCTVHRSPGDR